MLARTLSAVLRGALLLACSAALAGCAGWPRDPDAYQTRVRVPESPAQLSGQALAQKKQRMRQVYQDMVHFNDTAVSLRRHRDERGLEQFTLFLYRYIDDQLDPLLSQRGESWHPELQPLDANLLFAKAELLLELRQRWEVWKVIRELERRFDGMGSLPVDYPLGSRGTVALGLQELIRRRKRI